MQIGVQDYLLVQTYVILYQANQLFPFVLKKTAAYVLLTSAHVHFFIVK